MDEIYQSFYDYKDYYNRNDKAKMKCAFRFKKVCTT